MKLRSYKSARLKGKLVILRAALETPVKKRGNKYLVDDLARLKAIIPTIRYLQKNNCKIILVSYNGRPQKKSARYKFDPQAQSLSRLLGQKVKKLDDCLGSKVKKAVAQMESKEVVLLENTRFHPAERKNDPKMAKELASLGDIFINDAFGQSYEPHASTTAITKYLPSYAGPLLIKEITELTKLFKKPLKPFVAIIGGAKISNKIKVINKLLKKADYVLLGGALANTILISQGIQVGKSLIEKDYIKIAEKLPITDIHLKIPVDVMVATRISNQAKAVYRPAGRVGAKEIILDIGPDTIQLYKSVISTAKTIIWNGPMGKYEYASFAQGTKQIAKAVTEVSARTYVGGGETVDCLSDYGLTKKIDFISTGGGAMLKFLADETLPALKPLTIK